MHRVPYRSKNSIVSARSFLQHEFFLNRDLTILLNLLESNDMYLESPCCSEIKYVVHLTMHETLEVITLFWEHVNAPGS